MRHTVIRGILALVWLAAAVASLTSGEHGMAAMYGVIGIVFAYMTVTGAKKSRREGE